MAGPSGVLARPEWKWAWMAACAVPGLFVMSRALPPNWIEVGFRWHGSGSTQVLLLAGGLYAVFVCPFLCKTAVVPVSPHEDGLNSRTRRILFALITCLAMAFVWAGLTEFALRAMGQQSYRPPQLTASSDAGSDLFLDHAVLGYTHAPGRHCFDLRDGHSFVATHLSNTLRITRPPDSPKNNLSLPEIWLFGCSMTHGWSVGDDQTFSWLLDRSLPNDNVVNFGVTGYGSVQSLLQLREALDSGRRPALVVLAYASLHDERNTMQRSWRKIAGVPARPFARFNELDQLTIRFGRPAFHEWPGMRYSALIHAAERFYNQREAVAMRSHEVSRLLIGRFDALCREHEISWVLAGMDAEPATKAMLAFGRSQSWATVDMEVDLRLARFNGKPIDAHPNPTAHAAYAGNLRDYLLDAGFISGSDADTPFVNGAALGEVLSRHGG
ncbi:MAG: SGNH/GDSL hydrolase family protein [Planctomycetes bacterium]|nr:SGNH/GDSL hydrolase family protein [Planctomycetota bacterium]